LAANLAPSWIERHPWLTIIVSFGGMVAGLVLGGLILAACVMALGPVLAAVSAALNISFEQWQWIIGGAIIVLPTALMAMVMWFPPQEPVRLVSFAWRYALALTIVTGALLLLAANWTPYPGAAS